MLDVTIDFETYYGTNYSLTKMSTPEYVYHDEFRVHMMGIKINQNPTVIIEPDKIQETFDWLKTQEVNLIAHNMLFDGYIASQIYKYIPQRYTDTAAMARGHNPHASASLKNTCLRLWPGDETKRKGEELAKSFNQRNLMRVDGLFEAIAGYCQVDTDLCYWIYKRLEKKLPSRELEMIDLITRMFCDPVFKADTDLLSRYYQLLRKRREELIANSGTDEETLRSDAKYKAFLVRKGVTTPTKVSPTTGLVTNAFAKNDLEYQKLQREMPELQHIWDARQAAKSSIDITRTHRFLTVGQLTDRMPVMLRYSAAHTHRLGGGDKMNMQNLPRNAREDHPDGDLRPGVLRRSLCAPDEDHVVLVRDLSNIEARVLACIADQTDAIEIFRNKGDLYSEMASRIYGFTVTKETHPFERNVGKVAVLGLGYGMSGAKFKDTMNAGPMGMAPIFFDDESLYDRIVYQIYRKLNRGITTFWKACDRFIYWMITADPNDPLIYKCLKVYKGYIELPNGLRLTYPNIRHDKHGSPVYDGKSSVTKIYGGKLTENIVQALAQIVIKDIMLDASKLLPKWRVALQVHDEIVLVGPKNEVKKADKIIEKLMATPPKWMPELPLDSEGGWANNYSK